MALQADGSCLEGLASWYQHSATTFLRTSVDGLLDGFLIVGCRSVWLGAIAGDVVILAADYRTLDALFYLLVFLLVPFCSGTSQRHQQTKQYGNQYSSDKRLFLLISFQQ